jgi:hypothetical protein
VLRRRFVAALALSFLLGATPAVHHSRYIFAWITETRDPAAGWYVPGKMGHDALAVFDASPGASFGKLVSFVAVKGSARMAHHTNYELPPDNVLFANDWLANRTFVFDVADAHHPRVVRQFSSIGSYSYPHTFVHLANGDTLATFQYTGGFNKSAGGLVEFDTNGHVVRSGSAANPAVDKNIRPYSLAVSPELDRVVTGSADMMGAQSSHVAQIWRLSDLKLLATVPLPKQSNDDQGKPVDTSEPRTLADGKTVVVPTFDCGLYLVDGLRSAHPSLRRIYDFGSRVCEVPVVAGNYLVMAVESAHTLVSLDMRDASHPREVAHLYMGPNAYPHWIALEPNGNRLVIAGFVSLATHLRFATIDRATGQLTLDRNEINLSRSWPDGWQGGAVPHGTVFSNS